MRKTSYSGFGNKQSVADTEYCLDDIIPSELFPDPLDMVIESPRLSEIFLFPDTLVKIFAGKCDILVPYKSIEQIELLSRQEDLTFGAEYSSGIGIDRDACVCECLLLLYSPS